MANADIVVVGMGELPLIVDLFNDIFRPARELSFFQRRLHGRTNPLILLAQVGGRPAGFAVAYENKPRTFYCWLIGVLPSQRRTGVASQLMEALAAWARENEYDIVRFECFNQQRPMLHLAISQNYDIVGIRYDWSSGANLIVMEHMLTEPEEE